ncbi:MAG: DUF3443 family protein [Burkholderiaceae bacterium]
MAYRSLWVGVLLALALRLSSCGGNTTETTITGGGLSGGLTGPVVTIDSPSGPNTTEIVVDTGPASGFALGAANIPYVSVTVCAPGSASACVTIDHVFLDTGSIGLRVFASTVASVALPALTLSADAASSTPAGPAAECYPFVLGAVWGPIVRADVRIGGELAPSLPIQIIDDANPPTLAAPSDCVAAANGGLLDSPQHMQANGILGVGMIAYDCGLACLSGDYSGGHTLYYSCPNGACVPAAVPAAAQMQNPISSFVPGADGVANNNGSVVVLPAIPDLGASLVKGRLVFGIGTQTNNQIPLSAKIYPVDPNPASATYLYLGTSVDAKTFSSSYIDSGSNGLFFDDPAIAMACRSSSGSSGGWYCPINVVRKAATIVGYDGSLGTVDLAIANADVLFSGGNVGFANLGGSAGQGVDTFVWGLPFFYGRSVFTSIWGQALAANGPWNAF